MPSFARNAITADQLSALAEAALRQPEPKWLLVDHGIVDACKSSRVAAVLGWQRWPAYEGSALEGFGMKPCRRCPSRSWPRRWPDGRPSNPTPQA